MTDEKNNGARMEEAQAPAPESPENAETTAREEQPGFMPKVTFTTFVMSLASSALVNLGEVPDPDSRETRQDLLMAKHTIDILNMLEDKTRDNLDEAEDRLIKALLYELRMKYVIKAK